MAERKDPYYFVKLKNSRVFIYTDINTHFSLPLSDTDTFADMKEKIIRKHLLRYPDLGPIQIYSLKGLFLHHPPRCQGTFYELSDDMLVRSCIGSIKRRIYVEVYWGGHVAGEDDDDDQICDDITEKLCLATADLVSSDACTSSAGNPLN